MKTSRSLVLHKPDGEIISNADFNGMLDSSFSDVYKLLECDNTDSAVQLMYKRTIQLLYKQLTILERQVDKSKSPRAAYPVSTLAGTLREYLTDLQNIKDRENLAETIIENILRPLFLEMASTVVVELTTIKSEAKTMLDTDDYKYFVRNVIKISQDKIVQCMQKAYEEAKLNARKAL